MDRNNSIQLFEDRKIRTAWDEEREENGIFPVQDVIAVLAKSSRCETVHKENACSSDPELSANWGTICTLVEMPAADDKMQKNSETANTGRSCREPSSQFLLQRQSLLNVGWHRSDVAH